MIFNRVVKLLAVEIWKEAVRAAPRDLQRALDDAAFDFVSVSQPLRQLEAS